MAAAGPNLSLVTSNSTTLSSDSHFLYHSVMDMRSIVCIYVGLRPYLREFERVPFFFFLSVEDMDTGLPRKLISRALNLNISVMNWLLSSFRVFGEVLCYEVHDIFMYIVAIYYHCQLNIKWMLMTVFSRMQYSGQVRRRYIPIRISVISVIAIGYCDVLRAVVYQIAYEYSFSSCYKIER
jgi:hypothetical protein